MFFDHLANRRFQSGNFIRKTDQLDYLQEPDVFRDVFGHVLMLMNPVMADFIQAYGVTAAKSSRLVRWNCWHRCAAVHGGIWPGARGG